MWPSSSWDCVSPHTCVRCARDNTAEDDSCVFNKFICLCDERNKDGQRVPCLHQEIIEEHKNKYAQRKNSMPSFSGTTVTTDVQRKRRRRRKKNVQEYSQKFYATGKEDRLLETSCLLPVQRKKHTSDVYVVPDLRLNACSSGTEETGQVVTGSSSSSSSSSSSGSSSSSDTTSSSDSCSSSSTSSRSSCSGSTSTEERLHREECSQREVTKKFTGRGYEIMGSNSESKIDCDKEDRVTGPDSDSDTSGDTTSVSSDDSWWQKYEQLKDVSLSCKGKNSAKDSGYVSTTSPNTESAKTDE